MKSPAHLIVVSAFATAAALAQGPLTPPGPPAALFKTLQQIEPRTPIETFPAGGASAYQITQPGSYYLTSNLVAGAGQSGISVATNNVTIDLRGFTIFGVFNAPCVRTPVGGLVGIKVSGGRLIGGSSGVEFGNLGANTNCVFEDLEIVCAPGGSFRYGIRAGARAVARRCSVARADGTSSVGITLGNDSRVEDCLVLDSGRGVNVGSNSRVERCHIRNCATSQGIFAQNTCLIRNNVVEACDGGVRVDSQSVVTDNLVESSVLNGPGFSIAGSYNRLERNAAHFNGGAGISTPAGTTNFVVQNIAHGNGGGNYSFSGAVVAGPTVTTVGTVTNHPWANFSH